MKYPMLVISCLLMMGCGLTPQETQREEVQSAINDLCSALVDRDTGRLAQVFMPERLAEMGSTKQQQQDSLEHFIKQQREGLLMTYGVEARSPHVSEIIQGYGGSLTVSLEINNRVEPKALQMFQDSGGKVYFAGLRPAKVDPPGVSREGAAGSVELWWFKYRNYDDAHSKCVVTRYASSTCPGCCTSLETTTLNPAGHDNDRKTLQRNCLATWNSCAVKIVTVGNPSNCTSCVCGTTYCTSSCCYFNVFGDDFWWYNDGGGMPYCHADTCPTLGY